LNVLSLFDGISCGMLALQQTGIKVDKYYASEIDKYTIQVSKKNFPEIIQLGDINNWKNWKLPKIDLIIGGSPCTNLSNAGDRTGLEGDASSLFYKFVDIVKYYNPEYFLLENVKMKKKWRDIITKELGVEPILINSALVSAQNRERLYWMNFKVEQPEDKNILLKDIVFDDVFPVVLHNLYGGFKENSVRVFENKSPTIRTSKGGGHIPSLVRQSLIHSEKALEYMNRQVKDGRNHWDFGHFSDVRNPKSATIVANFFKGVPYNVFKDWDCIRKFHPIECERLQTLPDNYTEGVSDTQRYKMIGNGWTVDIVAHILSYLPGEYKF
jgi:DNA (cytosine-5)-methyltransferase 3A